jgi:hypothetical protein
MLSTTISFVSVLPPSVARKRLSARLRAVVCLRARGLDDRGRRTARRENGGHLVAAVVEVERRLAVDHALAHRRLVDLLLELRRVTEREIPARRERATDVTGRRVGADDRKGRVRRRRKQANRHG